jgi:hypothetical protein
MNIPEKETLPCAISSLLPGLTTIKPPWRFRTNFGMTVARRVAFLLLVWSFVLNAHCDPVRCVDATSVPALVDLQEHVRQIGNRVYPQILEILGRKPKDSPTQFKIVFVKRIESGNVAQARGDEIQLNGEWFTHYPIELDMTLIHEMVHVAQQYKRSPFYWTEGIADYVCYKLGYTNSWACPQCAAEYPHYTSGYGCAGAFLLYLDAGYDSNIVRKLDRDLFRGSYSEKLFLKATGRTLLELWTAFQGTAAFLPIAAEINKLRDSLGYVEGKPPKDLLDRIKKLPNGESSIQAGEFLNRLLEEKRLPGISADSIGSISASSRSG